MICLWVVRGRARRETHMKWWIIVATDYLTRYAETKALPSGTAVEVAKFFIESIVLRHGAPEVLITDRGSSFMAQLTQEILRLSHTSHRRTTAYHPQTNGLTERLNKTIAGMISMYVDVEHRTWDEVLPYVTFAYNTAVQETTGFTPFQLVHGRKVTTMLDAMLPHKPVDNESDDAQVVAQRAEEVRQLARLLIQDQQRVDAGRYNLRPARRQGSRDPQGHVTPRVTWLPKSRDPRGHATPDDVISDVTDDVTGIRIVNVIITDDVTGIRIVSVIITDNGISDVTDDVTGIRIVIVIITDDVTGIRIVIVIITDDVTGIRIVIVIIADDVISDVTMTSSVSASSSLLMTSSAPASSRDPPRSRDPHPRSLDPPSTLPSSSRAAL
ncbi:DDE-type integrase/transposase/recombinase [Ixodes scapularis]